MGVSYRSLSHRVGPVRAFGGLVRVREELKPHPPRHLAKTTTLEKRSQSGVQKHKVKVKAEQRPIAPSRALVARGPRLLWFG